MGKVKQYDLRSMQKILRNNGYDFVRQNGSHKIYTNGFNTIVVSLKLNPMVAQRIVKENNLIG